MATTRITDIIQIASRLSKVSRREIVGKARFIPIVMVRQAVCLLAVETGAHSTPLIGRHLGGRDHSTVIHGVRAARDKAARNPEYAHFIERCRQEMEIAEPFLEGWGEQYEFAIVFPERTEAPKPQVVDDAPIYYGGGYSMNREVAA
jgi:hypothetical protein